MYFHLLFSKGKWNTDMHVYRAEVTFLIWIGEITFFFFSIINLGCIIGYCVIFVYYNCTNKIYNRCILFVSNCFRRFSLVNRSWSVHVSLLIQTRWLFFNWRKQLIEDLDLHIHIGLSFWRHPFTVEVSKWCKATFLQIRYDKETNSSTSWLAWGGVHSANFHFWVNY